MRKHKYNGYTQGTTFTMKNQNGLRPGQNNNHKTAASTEVFYEKLVDAKSINPKSEIDRAASLAPLGNRSYLKRETISLSEGGTATVAIEINPETEEARVLGKCGWAYGMSDFPKIYSNAYSQGAICVLELAGNCRQSLVFLRSQKEQSDFIDEIHSGNSGISSFTFYIVNAFCAASALKNGLHAVNYRLGSDYTLAAEKPFLFDKLAVSGDLFAVRDSSSNMQYAVVETSSGLFRPPVTVLGRQKISVELSHLNSEGKPIFGPEDKPCFPEPAAGLVGLVSFMGNYYILKDKEEFRLFCDYSGIMDTERLLSGHDRAVYYLIEQISATERAKTMQEFASRFGYMPAEQKYVDMAAKHFGKDEPGAPKQEHLAMKASGQIAMPTIGGNDRAFAMLDNDFGNYGSVRVFGPVLKQLGLFGKVPVQSYAKQSKAEVGLVADIDLAAASEFCFSAGEFRILDTAQAHSEFMKEPGARDYYYYVLRKVPNSAAKVYYSKMAHVNPSFGKYGYENWPE